MNQRLFNAAKKYLVEICRSEDMYALVDYQLHLVELYSEQVANMIMEEVNYTLFNKYPDSYQWLSELANNYLENGEEIAPQVPILTADNLAGLLITEGDLEKKTFKFHPTDLDKLIVTPKAYNHLREILTEMYSTETTKVKVDIDYLVEITESV